MMNLLMHKRKARVIMENTLSSPFKYIDGMKAELKNENTVCSSESIESARAKNILTDIDMHIMRAIYDYGIANRNAVTAYINNHADIPDSIKKPDYTRNFHNMVNHGILLRFTFLFGENSTPNVYTLSAGAKKYMARIVGRGFAKKYRSPEIDPVSEPAGALRLIAFNQFYMRLVTAGYSIKRTLYNYTLDSVLIDGIAQINPSAKTGSPYYFTFLCLRNYSGWQTTYRKYLSTVFEKKEKLLIGAPTFVIIVESYLMAAEAERYRKTLDSNLSDINVYYLPDIMTLSDKPLDTVFYIKPDNGFSDYEEIPLCLGQTKKNP